jgi:putative transcriptional regulator
MNINHHLDEATLFSYVAGSLSQGMALVVASHISICDSCRDRVFETEAIGGALLNEMVSDNSSDGSASVKVDETALEQVLACLDQEEPTISLDSSLSDGESDACSPGNTGEVPAPLSDYIGGSLDAVQWKRLSPGFYYFDVFKEQRGICRLLKVAPGKSILPHGHHGNELTLLLRGSYADEVGRFAQGDVADLDDQIEHQPLVDGNEDCICLVATDYPLRFTTLLGKVIQPITRF